MRPFPPAPSFFSFLIKWFKRLPGAEKYIQYFQIIIIINKNKFVFLVLHQFLVLATGFDLGSRVNERIFSPSLP